MKKQTSSRAFKIATYVIGIALILVLALGVISASATSEMNVLYDDYIDITGKTVEIIDAGTPTSFKVGYNIAANTPDNAVIQKTGNSLRAVGIGTAKVKIDGEEVTINVKPAPITILLLAGQSNMHGSEGDASASIVCPNGQTYSTYGVPGSMTAKNAASYAASTLAGETCNLSVTGTKSALLSNPTFAFEDRGGGKVGMDSGIAYEWIQKTNEKIWIINASHGGSTIESWLADGDNYKEALVLFQACQEVLRKEIAAGHYTFSHMGYLWCQGEAGTNANKSAAVYLEQFTTMHKLFKDTMAFDHDSDPTTADVTFEFAGNIPVRKGSENSGTYRMGTYPEEYVAAGKNISHYESFYDLRMSGPRVAQFWMGNNPEMPDIWNICTIQEKWVVFPDGTNGVADYFKAHYPNGRVDYKTQVEKGETWRKPTTPNHVHDTIHYNQVGYNELGRECARNILYNLGMVEPPETEVTVDFVCWDGFTPVTTMGAYLTAESRTLVVPIVSPIYKSKEVKIIVNGDFTYDLYDLVAGSFYSFGGITVEGADSANVIVPRVPLDDYKWQLEGSSLVCKSEATNNAKFVSGSYTSGAFSKAVVGFDKPIYLMNVEPWTLEWKMSGAWYGSGSTGAKKLFAESNESVDVGGAFVMINGKTNSIAIGQYTGAKNELYGICLADHNIKISDEHVYKLVNKLTNDGNMIYLYVDGKEIGPMNNVLSSDGTDSGTDNNWVSGKSMFFSYMGAPRYELDKGNIEYISSVSHVHNYKDTVTAPTCTEKGYTTHSCICGESYTDTEVDAKGHDYNEVVKAPTCTEKGSKTYTCECGETYTEEIDIVDHTYDNDKDADCNVCGETRTVETEPSKGKDDGKDKGGCGSAKSSGLALISLFLCAQVGVFFKKRKF